jgi:hypothetical protein
MKKLILLFARICLIGFPVNISVAQAPDWQWAKSAGGIDFDRAYSVALDASGNIYITGAFESPAIVFGSDTLANAGYNDLFLIKYDAAGNILWAKRAGGGKEDGGQSVTLDASGNIYVAGWFDSPEITFDSYTLTNAGYENIMFAKYDAGGNVLWAKSAGGTGVDFLYAIACDASGNVYLTGEFRSPVIIFGADTLRRVGAGDVFLAKYDASGNALWARSAGGTDFERADDVSLDASGNAYITGIFNSSVITFGSFTLTKVGIGNVFVVKYDADGNVIWAKSAQGSEYDYGYSVAPDASGNVYVTGSFGSPVITFDSDTLKTEGSSNIFLVKYNSGGNVQWAKSAHGYGPDLAYSVALDVSGNPYVTGWFDSPEITFGSYTLTNKGNRDGFVAKYDFNGTVLWAKSFGGTSYDEGVSVALDAPGNACVTGYFYSSPIAFGSDKLTNKGSGDMFLAKLSSPTGINEVEKSMNISIFPNPSTDKITIETPAEKEGSTITIANIRGQVLLKHKANKSITTIDVSTLPDGIYIVKMVNKNRVHVGKFIKR